MTDTPNLKAAVMRARAAEAMAPMLRSMISRGYAADLILALPLEATPDQLLGEAVKLPEIAALIEAAKKTHIYLGDASLGSLTRALQPFLALETP